MCGTYIYLSILIQIDDFTFCISSRKVPSPKAIVIFTVVCVVVGAKGSTAAILIVTWSSDKPTNKSRFRGFHHQLSSALPNIIDECVGSMMLSAIYSWLATVAVVNLF